MKHTIKLGEYSEFPAGRYAKHSSSSAEEFKKNILFPAMEKHDLIEINFDGVYTISYTFACEIGRTMIQDGLITYEEHKRRISLVTPNGENEYEIELVNKYLDDHKPQDYKPHEAQ